MYTFLILDLKEVICVDVYSDGEIKTLFKDTSLVPHKHKKGGQSAKRFSQQRANEIVQWFKEINESFKSIKRDNVIIGVSWVYKKKFESFLVTENINKVEKYVTNIEYCGINGVYDLINRLKCKAL